MIYGYAARASVWPGDDLTVHVSCGSGRFRVALYRWAGRLLHMSTTRWLGGERVGPRSADVDWDWPAYQVPVARDWPSGVYVAHLEERGCAPVRIAMIDAAVLFIVRGPGQSPLLYKIPLATYNAYNHAGGSCFYDRPPRSLSPPGARLSFHRPGGGIGGPTFGAPDYYDNSSPRQTFAHWDARFIAWLLQEGYAPEFCSDLDIHDDPALLRRHRLLLSVGHDEYWSEPMRDALEHFVDHGGNVAFFAANVCWWRIHLVDEGAAMVCHQGGPAGALDHWWPAWGAARPEDALSGASYRHGGGWWDGPRKTSGYAVQESDHWVFKGTGLQGGQTFGAATCPPLVGYECDGVPLSSFEHATGTAGLSAGAGDFGTPRGISVLAASPLDARWQELPAREAFGAGHIHAATMSIFTRGGTVFNAGTTDWAQVLGTGQEPHVETITRNVIDRLLADHSHPT